jgi:signal transduction histidine kinase
VNRLYLRIWLAFLGILVVFGVLVSALWWLTADERPGTRVMEGIRTVVERSLPAATVPVRELQRVLDDVGARLEVDITVHAAGGALIAHVGPPAPPPRLRSSDGARIERGFARGPFVVMRLDDGRIVTVRPRRPPRFVGLLGALGVLLATTAVGAYFVVRRITGRLERLRTRVDALGSGDLTARVDIEGRDEIAQLAASFNQAAGRIEQLLGAQKTLLANVSHELRTPLTRMRMGLELLGEGAPPELVGRMRREIGELDSLVGDLLLASRLDAGVSAEPPEPLDLLGLAAEVASEYGLEISGESVTIVGEPKALRRLVRNLLENARRHGAGQPFELTVHADTAGGGRIVVSDRGPGVPEHERERIFEPFHRVRVPGEGPEGTGLGLALVRQIAHRHRGAAQCLPRAGGGSEFHVSVRSIAPG